MRVGVVGINHKLADLKLREMLAKACQRRFGPGQSTQENHTFVLLSTCNRTEVYFSSEDLASTHTYLLSILRNEVEQEFDQKLYSYFGQDCFLHLSRVTAGLDSAIIAETEIQGQVKNAYESAVEYATLPPEVHYLFQKSLTIGKKVRSKLQMRRGLPDLEDAILNTGMHLFEEPHKAKILFVGASEINLKVIGFLKEKQFPDITLCNRSLNHAQMVAEQFQLDILAWDKLQNWHDYDWIIFGTKSPEYVIQEQHIPVHQISQKLVIDLCVPRNVEPKLGRHPNVTLLNIDQINRSLRNRTQRMIHSVTRAEELVSTAAQVHSDLFHQKEKARQRFLAIGA
jgi:glutamyl-tRNA reductase